MKKEKMQFTLSIFMYILSIILLLTFIIFSIKGNLVNYKGEAEIIKIVFFALSICLTSYLGSLQLSLCKEENKYLSKNMIICLLIYLFLFYFFTNINRGLNFNFVPVHNWSFNFIPFKEIISIIYNSIQSNHLNGLVLIAGNFFVLVPLAYLYPRVIKSTKKFSNFIIAIVITTLLIETSQVFFGGGVFDVDDLLLNSLGPITFYNLFNKSFLSKSLDNIFLLKKNNLSKKELIKTILFISFLIIAFIVCIYFYWYHDFAIEMQIINTSEVCEEDKILIYEDEYYKYYSCKNIDDIKLIINQKHKYKLKDVLDSKVKSRYVKDFAKFAKSHLKGYDFIELVPKYPILEVIYPSDNVSIGPSFENYDVIHFGDISFGKDKNKSIYKAMLTPKKSGKTKIDFNVYTSPEHELIETITYEVVVDENMNVTYMQISSKDN